MSLHRGRGKTVVWSPFYKDTNPFMKALPSRLSHLPKVPCNNIIHCLGGLGFHEFGRTHSHHSTVCPYIELAGPLYTRTQSEGAPLADIHLAMVAEGKRHYGQVDHKQDLKGCAWK
jgi:hypothetical protein